MLKQVQHDKKEEIGGPEIKLGVMYPEEKGAGHGSE